MTLSNDSLNQLLLLFGKYQKQLHLIVVLLLSLYLIAYAAELTWKLIPAPQQQTSTATNSGVKATQSNGSRQQVNISALKRLNLFGELGAEPQVQEETVTDAPETNLNLTLAGVVAAQNPELGTAIIGNKGKQAAYAVGEKIESTRAILKEVYADRIIIRNGARNETLMLDGVDYKQASVQQAARPAARPTPAADNRVVRTRLSREALATTRQIQQKPAQFTDFIAIAPFTQEGELQGYRVSPGKQPTLFKEAGFKAGDVVVDINGLDLRDAQQALEAMNALREAQALQLTVNRKGELLTLYLDIPEEDKGT